MHIIEELNQHLSQEVLITSKERMRVFECDGLSAYRQLPLAVVLPNTIEQIQTVLKLCRKSNTPIVTRGAGTGLSGGALPLKKGILLVLSKFNKILSIDPDQRIARVQVGVRNIQISQAAAPYDLYYAPDPSSQLACTIGGNVAENSGGVHCLKYGLTVHNVLAVKIMTIDGEIKEFNHHQEGIDLLALINGSEGLLGIILEVTVKLLPKPQDTQLIVAGFKQITQCADAVKNIIENGIIPAGLEMMDKFAIQAAEDFVKVGYPLDMQALLLCEVDGTPQQTQSAINELEIILRESGATYITIARDSSHREALWKGRKSAFPAVGRLSPDYYCMDGTIPRHKLAEVLTKMEELSQQYQLKVANVFHAGDGNLHPLIMYDANIPGELERTEEFGEKILELCVEVGGTITGEHGVGVEKIDSMCVQFTPAELEIFHGIRKVFDPMELLNPGKAVPTLNRCAELGKMHVHHNQLPHSELERF